MLLDPIDKSRKVEQRLQDAMAVTVVSHID
jgi:hypothetical protein